MLGTEDDGETIFYYTTWYNWEEKLVLEDITLLPAIANESITVYLMLRNFDKNKTLCPLNLPKMSSKSAKKLRMCLQLKSMIISLKNIKENYHMIH